MNDFTVKLRILKDILQKKKDALAMVLNITHNQETILQSPASPDRNAFFSETASEKQKLIDSVREYDELFQGIFNPVKEGLEEKIHEDISANKPEIMALQALISEILELDIAIRGQEMKNNSLLTSDMSAQTQQSKPAPTAEYRRQVIDRLSKNKKM